MIGDRTSPPGADHSVDASQPHEPTAVERRQERSARDARQKALVFAAILGVILALTAWFAGLNAYILAHRVPRPYTLQLAETDTPVTLSVAWRAGEGAGAADAHPSLAVRPLGGAAAARPLPVVVEGAGVWELLVTIPADATPGPHMGTLTATAAGGDWVAATRTVEVEVTANPWRDWFLLRWWIAFGVFVWLLVHVFCRVAFSPPAGKLLLTRYGDDFGAPGGQSSSACRTFALHAPRIAWLLPWRRSTIPLQAALKHWKMPWLKRVHGTLWFLLPGVAPRLEITGGLSRVSRRRWEDAPPELPGTSRAGPVVLLSPWTEVLIEHPETGEAVGLRYQQPRPYRH